MIDRRREYDRPASEVYADLRAAIEREMPPALRAMIRWDDAARKGNAAYQGAVGEFVVEGEKPCTVRVNVAIGFPAAMVVGEEAVGILVDRVLARMDGAGSGDDHRSNGQRA